MCWTRAVSDMTKMWILGDINKGQHFSLYILVIFGNYFLQLDANIKHVPSVSWRPLLWGAEIPKDCLSTPNECSNLVICAGNSWAVNRMWKLNKLNECENLKIYKYIFISIPNEPFSRANGHRRLEKEEESCLLILEQKNLK